jgi:predicted nucleotidyltransferase component of viral defense system
MVGPPYYDPFEIPVLTLEEATAEKLRTLLQRRRPTDLSDIDQPVCQRAAARRFRGARGVR